MARKRAENRERSLGFPGRCIGQQQRITMRSNLNKRENCLVQHNFRVLFFRYDRDRPQTNPGGILIRDSTLVVSPPPPPLLIYLSDIPANLIHAQVATYQSSLMTINIAYWRNLHVSFIGKACSSFEGEIVNIADNQIEIHTEKMANSSKLH
ncbi:hypothetical protein TNCV_2629511 [Trichonephila clavipes]|uniref:Uncharacterized protein n=1 Tax=Trichonephila clavipes TaxID=2585209 RepID=A0A8X6SJG6_TRICX|nr:hypothetical protein TNCV_2629511 [Trichonephila clavipes]